MAPKQSRGQLNFEEFGKRVMNESELLKQLHHSQSIMPDVMYLDEGEPLPEGYEYDYYDEEEEEVKCLPEDPV